PSALEREADAAIRRVGAKQLEVGIDVGNDGEMPRPGFSTYVAGRMRGFGGESKRRLARDLIEHPDFEAMLAQRRRAAARIGNAPQCVGEIDYADLGAAGREGDLLLAAAQAQPAFAERVRPDVCWGNYDGPHTHDVPLEPLLPHLYRARVGALSLPLANPRHQHEYKVLKRNPPPGTMLLLPGVIDSTTNYVEHPEVVADRICQAVEAVGDRTRIIASPACGFGTSAGSENVADSVVW